MGLFTHALSDFARDSLSADTAMCLLIVLKDVVDDWPLVVAANREEYYDRQGEPPQLLLENPRVFGGRDPRAAGTWLAVNQWAMICAVTNRARIKSAIGDLRSRGLLCLDAARQRSPVAVADMIGRSVAENDYDDFNLFCSTLSDSRVFYFDGRLRENALGSGIFVTTTADTNDFSLERVKDAHDRLKDCCGRSLEQVIEQLQAECRDHGSSNAGRSAQCVHGEKSGTLSSSIVAFHRSDPRQHLFLHCQGRPCEKPYELVPWPSDFF